jgi:chorismate synthase
MIGNVLPGIGSYTQWDRRLDSRLAGAVMGIQGIKAVEIGNGYESAELYGSQFHDEIYYSHDRGYFRGTNNSGGIEGGVTNGEKIILRACMKPIPTLKMPLKSVNVETKQAGEAVFERSDTCAVPSASIVARNVCMWEIACALSEKFRGDSMEELQSNYNQYISYLKGR